MDTLQKAFEDAVTQIAKTALTKDELEKLSEAIPARLEEALFKLPHEILTSIKGKAAEGLKERRDLHAEFVERNIQRWQDAFDLLELHLEIATEAGELFNQRLRPEAAASGDILFDVLVRLHAKGCLVSKEILCLLKNGYADGAHARWRALHEISVTAMFLALKGTEAAQRFLDHRLVESYKGASQLRKYQSRLNIVGFDDAELAQLKAQYDSIITKYGKDFKSTYGWAQPFLTSSNDTFFALEEAVELDHWRPYYKWASQNVHANAKTIENSLGLCEAKEDMLQVGPSNSGMTDPAHSTTISLSQLTCTLLTYTPNVDGLVMTKMLLSLSDEVGEAFIQCSEKAAI